MTEVELLTEEEITALYVEKQKEEFPRRKLWLGAFYAVVFIAASMGLYLFFFWVVMKIVL